MGDRGEERTMQQPVPQKRELKIGGGVAIGGAPVAYTAILAAIGARACHQWHDKGPGR